MAVYVYVDLQNVRRKNKKMIDWGGLRRNILSFAARKGHSADLVIKAFYSKQEKKDFGSWFEPLSERLKKAGVIGVEREAKKPKNHDDSKNVDVLMAVEIMEDVFAGLPEAVVIVTGDGDFVDLVTRVRQRCPVYIYHPSGGSLSSNLQTVANDVI